MQNNHEKPISIQSIRQKIAENESLPVREQKRLDELLSPAELRVYRQESSQTRSELLSSHRTGYNPDKSIGDRDEHDEIVDESPFSQIPESERNEVIEENQEAKSHPDDFPEDRDEQEAGMYGATPDDYRRWMKEGEDAEHLEKIENMKEGWERNYYIDTYFGDKSPQEIDNLIKKKVESGEWTEIDSKESDGNFSRENGFSKKEKITFPLPKDGEESLVYDPERGFWEAWNTKLIDPEDGSPGVWVPHHEITWKPETRFPITFSFDSKKKIWKQIYEDGYPDIPLQSGIAIRKEKISGEKKFESQPKNQQLDRNKINAFMDNQNRAHASNLLDEAIARDEEGSMIDQMQKYHDRKEKEFNDFKQSTQQDFEKAKKEYDANLQREDREQLSHFEQSQSQTDKEELGPMDDEVMEVVADKELANDEKPLLSQRRPASENQGKRTPRFSSEN